MICQNHPSRRGSEIRAIIEAFDNGNGARQEDVLKACKKKGIPGEEAMEIINKMRESGEIFSRKVFYSVELAELSEKRI